MGDLTVDLAAVTGLGHALSVVAHEFEGANARSDQVSDAVGHPGLAESVRSFAHGWDDKREKMTESLRTLADAATTVASTFADADDQLSAALEGETR